MRRVMVFAAAALVAGCAELGGIMRLQQELVREFASPEVNVNLTTSGQLTVVFQNSPLGDLDSVPQAKIARQVAEFVRDHYVAYAQLNMINVGFGTRRGAGPVTVTNTRVPYSYRTADLGAPVRADSTGDTARRPAA